MKKIDLSINNIGRFAIYLCLFVALFNEVAFSWFGVPAILSSNMVYFVTIIGMLVIALDIFRSHDLIIEIHSYSVPILLFLIYVLVSALINSDLQTAFYYTLRFMCGFVCFWLMGRYAQERDLEIIKRILLILLVLHLGLILYQRTLQLDQDEMGGIFGIRFGTSNTLSHSFLLVVSVLCFVEYIKNRVSFFTLVMIVLISIACAAITEIKVYYFELVALGALTLFAQKNKLKSFILVIAISLVIIVGLTLFYNSNMYFDNFFSIEGIRKYLSEGYAGKKIAVSRTNGFLFITEHFFDYSIPEILFGKGFSKDFHEVALSYNVEFFSYSYLYFYGGAIGSFLFYFSIVYIMVSAFKNESVFSFLSVVMGIVMLFTIFYDSALIFPTGSEQLFFIVLAFGLVSHKKCQALSRSANRYEPVSG